MWIEERKANGLPHSNKNKSVYEDVFYRNFNLSFKSPRTDVCATCRELTAKSRSGPVDERKAATLKLKLHRLRYKKFYSMVRQIGKCRDTLVLCFDLQQTMPIPKTNISDAFYARQVWVYNFGIVQFEKKHLTLCVPTTHICVVKIVQNRPTTVSYTHLTLPTIYSV